jgi:O-antigen ligase
MPRTLFGVSGANPWNLILLGVVLGWARSRLTRQDFRKIPGFLKVAVIVYVAMIVIAFVRGVLDLGSYRCPPGSPEMTEGSFTIEYIVNPLKYVAAACLLFDGLRTRRAVVIGLAALVAQVVCLSLLALRYIPVSSLVEIGATTSQAESIYRQRFQKEIGLHANDAALVLVAGFWLLLVSWGVLSSAWRPWRFVGALLCGACGLAVCLTNSRAGYVAVIGVGMLLGLVWRRRLLLGLVAIVLLACIAFPSVVMRAQHGIGAGDAGGGSTNDLDAISGGRTTSLWPAAVEQIERAALVGSGRMAIYRTPMYESIVALQGDCPNHPHSAYLEIMVDSGFVGLVIVVVLFVGLPVMLAGRRYGDPVLDAGRCAGLAGVATLLLMGISGQSFWPREGVETILYLYAVLAGSYVLEKQGHRSSATACHDSRLGAWQGGRGM